MASLLALAAACGGKDTNQLPPSIRASTVSTTAYDGNSDDLLTAGLGKTGLAGAAPAPADPANPTVAELRRLAIYNNYRALVDMTAAGGYGSLYGPNVDVSGANTLGEGKIAGEEWIALAYEGAANGSATLMVQVPATFDPKNSCIVTATSSGSRGVYGAMATAGEWGLKHGCAVAYTDKGTGMGAHDLQNNTVNQVDGTRAVATSAADKSNFTADLSDADRAAFNTANPNRFAFKHAHSQVNSEKNWGLFTLRAVEFAFYVLNEKFGEKDGSKHLRTITQGNTITIAASVSNGAGAALAAAEQDTQGLISGVVAGEPQVQVASTATIQRGGVTQASTAKSLYEYTTTANLYQGCAATAAAATAAGMLRLGDSTQEANRCAALKAKGLLTATTASAQADEALAKMMAAGWQPESNLLMDSHFGAYATTAVTVTYANAYSRSSVKDNLCGYSYALADAAAGGPVATSASAANQAVVAQIFGTGNGVPPTGAIAGVQNFGISLINNASVGGPARDQGSTSASTGKKDYNVDGAVCLRNLATGTDVTTGAALTGDDLAKANAMKAGIAQVQRTARVRGKPTILVQGRADALVPVNHASRAYFGANKLADGANSDVVYYEVENAQHFDAFLGFPGFGTRFVPLHRYVVQSLDLMYAHLKTKAALPASQVVRTTPRATAGTTITTTNVPPISATPVTADQITFANGTVSIPE
jgi:hydroxybutyrate-dimer hydrolase